MKPLNNKPSPPHLTQFSNGTSCYYPLTPTAIPSQRFSGSPAPLKLSNSELEYVPFERVYYESQPVKRVEYVSVERRVIEYLPVERTVLSRAISPLNRSEMNRSPINRTMMNSSPMNIAPMNICPMNIGCQGGNISQEAMFKRSNYFLSANAMQRQEFKPQIVVENFDNQVKAEHEETLKEGNLEHHQIKLETEPESDPNQNILQNEPKIEDIPVTLEEKSNELLVMKVIKTEVDLEQMNDEEENANESEEQKPLDGNDDNLIVESQIQPMEEFLIQKNPSQIENPMDLMVSEPEIRQSAFARHIHQNQDSQPLRFSQGPFVPNRSSYPVKPSNPVLMNIVNYSINRARFESGDNFPENQQTLSRSIHGLNRMQSIETVNRGNLSYSTTPLNSSMGFSYRMAHQNAQLQRLETFESPLNRISMGPIPVHHNEPDYAVLGEIRRVEPGFGKLKKVQDEVKFDKAQKRVLVPPIREGSTRDRFQMPNLRQTNNEYILEALRSQQRANQISGQPFGVNYYVSPYLTGYLKKD